MIGNGSLSLFQGSFGSKNVFILKDGGDENGNDTGKDADDGGETMLKPAFPDGRRVSAVQTQCCNGFNQSGVCNIL